jgi:methionyl-tRNA formyltransferase
MRILFFGSPEFAEVSLRALVAETDIQVVGLVTQPDRPFGRGQELRAPPIKEFALQNKIPVFQPPSIRKDIPGFLGQISALGAIDVGVVIAFGQILPSEILALPKLGCINVHASLLPRWRGAAPIQRAIEAGDRETGVCLMQMDAGLDTGPVFVAEPIDIRPEETAGELTARLAELGAEVLVRDIFAIESSSIEAVSQSLNGVTYAKKITNDEAKVDWSLPADVLARKISAFNPAPGAFTVFQGKRLKIFRAAAKKQLGPVVAPGTINLAEKQAIEVQTGQGVLSLVEVQLEGKKRVTVNEFVAGTQGLLGSSLG